LGYCSLLCLDVVHVKVSRICVDVKRFGRWWEKIKDEAKRKAKGEYIP
jgi:hypothetical protein